MSVDTDATLAGNDTATATSSRRSRAKQPPAPPRPLTLYCEHCDRRITGNGAGFAAVDLREASAAAHGELVTVDGLAIRAPWSVWHAHCAPWALKPLNPYFRIWVDRISTVDDLLDAMAELSRLPWFGSTDWGGLVRRILADREARADQAKEIRVRAAQHRARRYAEGLSDDDPRHGTPTGFVNWGCQCEPCTRAYTQDRQRRNSLRASETNQQQAVG
jgi:hypothetical protein